MEREAWDRPLLRVSKPHYRFSLYFNVNGKGLHGAAGELITCAFSMLSLAGVWKRERSKCQRERERI